MHVLVLRHVQPRNMRTIMSCRVLQNCTFMLLIVSCSRRPGHCAACRIGFVDLRAQQAYLVCQETSGHAALDLAEAVTRAVLSKKRAHRTVHSEAALQHL